jgi:hypothetical protein
MALLCAYAQLAMDRVFRDCRGIVSRADECVRSRIRNVDDPLCGEGGGPPGSDSI